MRHRALADAVTFVGDENGWELHVETDDGDTFVFNVHALVWDLVEQVDATIGAWRREGEAVRSEVRAKPSEIFDDGYSPSDPKSSGYHDRMSAIHDNRTKETA